jgi:flagellar biosynthesis protein FliR
MDQGAASIGAQHLAIGVFLLFCRIGSCLMLAPGFSSGQIPVQIRLFVALAVTLTLAPMLYDKIPAAALTDEPGDMLSYMFSEFVVGITIGLLSRLFFAALETMSVAVATNLGLANVFGAQFDQSEGLPPLATFISITATSLIFIMDLHWQILQGILQSYDAVPIDARLHAALSLRQIVETMSVTFLIALRVASPFIVYSLIVNLAVSLINRLTPQIAIFYISTPFVVGGGLALLYLVLRSAIYEFMVAYSTWLSAR